MTFKVVADKQYLDGFLAGLPLVGGYSVTAPTRRDAVRIASWVNKVYRERDFVRAVGTAHRYVFTSPASIERA